MPIEMPDRRVREFLAIADLAAVYIASAGMVHRVGAAADLQQTDRGIKAVGKFSLEWAVWVSAMPIAEHLANSTIAVRHAMSSPTIYAPNIEGMVNMITKAAHASQIPFMPHDVMLRRASKCEEELDAQMERMIHDGALKDLKRCYRMEKARREAAKERMISYETFISGIRKEVGRVLYQARNKKPVDKSVMRDRILSAFPWVK